MAKRTPPQMASTASTTDDQQPVATPATPSAEQQLQVAVRALRMTRRQLVSLAAALGEVLGE